MDNSLVSYKLIVQGGRCQGSSPLARSRHPSGTSLLTQDGLLAARFPPLLRVYSTANHESKYYPDANIASLHLHGSSPYLFFSDTPSSVNFQLFQDPTCASHSATTMTTTTSPPPIKIALSIDPYTSLGKIVMRYRLVLASWPLGIVLLSFGIQLASYYRGGKLETHSSCPHDQEAFPLPLTQGGDTQNVSYNWAKHYPSSPKKRRFPSSHSFPLAASPKS
jgi:hypothetical protein